MHGDREDSSNMLLRVPGYSSYSEGGVYVELGWGSPLLCIVSDAPVLCEGFAALRNNCFRTLLQERYPGHESGTPRVVLI